MFKALGNLFGTGKKTTTTTTNTSSTPTLPSEVEAARRDLFERSRQFADQGFQPYDQPRIAGFTLDQLAGFQRAREISDASGALAPLTSELTREGVDASRRFAVGLPDVDIQAYMSPYTEAALEPALRDIMERSAQERMRLGQQAARTGAFGGSRQAIAEAELERSTGRNIGELSAKERANAYNNALAQFRLDQQRIPQLYAGALGMVGTGQEQNEARLRSEVAPLVQIGGAQQALSQAELDFARQQFEEQRDYPLRGIEVLRGNLGLPSTSLGIGSTGTTTATQTAPGPNVLGQILGTATMLPGATSGATGSLTTMFNFLRGLGGSGSSAPTSNAQVYQNAGVPTGYGPI
jgi:hypothetical protein